jgi:hypothetical protein
MFGKGAKPVVQDAREAILLRAPAGQDSVAELYASKQTTHRSHFAFQVKLLRYAAAVLSKTVAWRRTRNLTVISHRRFGR